MTVLYNENDPFAADWLESLIAHGHISQGQVDRRSIADLRPADVTGPGQRHFFAGIGGWSYALRLAGVPDDADIWTGSCPCQPFSDAGQGQGVLDPRHLWPAWFALIPECRPPIIFGEQVASKDGLGWLDVVFADLERCGYTIGAADLCAAGVGAPHARQRLYFVAHTDRVPRGLLLRPRGPRDTDAQARGGSEDSSVANSGGAGLEVEREQQARGERATTERGGEAESLAHARRARSRNRPAARGDDQGEQGEGPVDAARSGSAGVMADAQSLGRRQGRQAAGGDGPGPADHRASCDLAIPPGATGGFWADAEWILCRDPSGGPPVARPVEPGTFPLAHGIPGRVGRLRGAGNAIVPQVAAAFIRSALEAISDNLP